jgi:ADP-ribosyl-[dinitrogen reductase] hydrolase
MKAPHIVNPRTSLSHPLHIATLPIGAGAGAVGVTFCPGKQGDSVFGAPWARDVGLDLDIIQAWGAAAVLTLVEGHELISLGVPDLGERIVERGLQRHQLPIADLNPPGPTFEAGWPAVAAQLHRLIADGGRVLVHCRGGLGRAGTVAACLLVELGEAPGTAIRRVRAARPHAIETAAQERYVLGHKPRTAPTEI